MPATIINDPVICDRCGDQVVDAIRVGEHMVCADCAQTYPECDGCGDRVLSVLPTVEGRRVCSWCQEHDYSTCDCCQRVAFTLLYATDGQSVCTSCEETCYWWCDRCDNLNRVSERCDCDRDEFGEYEQDRSGHIHDIHNAYYKPTPQFHGIGPVYLGFELEISTPDLMLSGCARTAVDRLGRLGYLKSDCTINHETGYGFELVTHPMSYDWALANFPWPLLAELDDADCTGEGNGLHVHVSRAAFDSPAHIYRWMKLFYRNEDQVTTVARRYSAQWADFSRYERRAVKDYAKGASGDRYTAINTCPTDTFELRIFASSLDQQQVQAALALAAASVEYTRALSVADITGRDGWDWAAFADWVHARPVYAPLSREMERLSCAC